LSDPESQLALNLAGVSKSYGAFQAVRDLSFGVERGTICGFLGPNGAGKTTTVRMILGLSAPTAGDISVLGGTGLSVRDRIGFLPEERGLYRKMSAIDCIIFLAGLKGISAPVARKRAANLLESQGLGAFMKQPVKALSKGMSQKVQLIATLVHEPELVILDEPFSGLDPVNQEGLEVIIRDLATKGTTVLFSTHIMQHAERLCQKVVMLTRGQKVFEGSLKAARATAPRFLELEGQLNETELASLPGVVSVHYSGPALDGAGLWRLQLNGPEAAKSALQAAFARGLDLQRFETREPSVHEAFIVLTGAPATEVTHA
jgi:ABC-2 type transport system ATP-binding protein